MQGQDVGVWGGKDPIKSLLGELINFRVSWN